MRSRCTLVLSTSCGSSYNKNKIIVDLSVFSITWWMRTGPVVVFLLLMWSNSTLQ